MSSLVSGGHALCHAVMAPSRSPVVLITRSAVSALSRWAWGSAGAGRSTKPVRSSHLVGREPLEVADRGDAIAVDPHVDGRAVGRCRPDEEDAHCGATVAPSAARNRDPSERGGRRHRRGVRRRRRSDGRARSRGRRVRSSSPRDRGQRGRPPTRGRVPSRATAVPRGLSRWQSRWSAPWRRGGTGPRQIAGR